MNEMDAGAAARRQREIIRLERELMSGKRLAVEQLERLPKRCLLVSPLLLKAYGELKADAGALSQAKEALQSALKGFGRHTHCDGLLAAFAGLAAVCLRIGDLEQADTILRFLRSEYLRGESPEDGQIPLALARGASLLGEPQRREGYYESALAMFQAAGDDEFICRTLLESALHSGHECIKRLTEKQAYLRQRRSRNSFFSAYSEAFSAVCLFREERWEEARRMLAALDWSRFPYHLTAALLFIRAMAAIRGRQEHAEEDADAARAWLLRFEEDAAVPFELARLKFEQALARRDAGETRAALEQAKTCRRLCEPLTGPDALAQMEQAAERIELARQASVRDGPGPWSVICFGGLRLMQGAAEAANIPWKRKKSKELFIYLALQPGYAAGRDQVVETIFADGEPSKQANRLYVTVYQLKQTLKDHLGVEGAVLLKDGYVKIADHAIDFVDTEKYNTLIRVAEQLWTSDRSLSAELYSQAVQMYAELLPEMPYIDWLDAARNHFAELQANALRKLSSHAADTENFDAAESYCRQWLRLKPAEEEAYQQMMRVLMMQNKIAEANYWYRQLEKMCLEELQTAPLPESRQIVLGSERGKRRE